LCLLFKITQDRCAIGGLREDNDAWDLSVARNMMTQSRLERTRIHNRLPVAREGIPFIIVGCFVTLILFLLGLRILPVVTALFTLFTVYFFRDPGRDPEIEERAVLSPADGKIVDIRKFEDDHNPLGEPCLRVGIFMSIFNVHVNRVPVSGKIIKISYHPGKFFSANLDKASAENENKKIILETDDGKRLMTVQIAGLIARRIVCWIKENDQVIAGNRFGLIRFGSRLDVYFPQDSQITVQYHQKVRAGETKLGYLP